MSISNKLKTLKDFKIQVPYFTIEANFDEKEKEPTPPSPLQKMHAIHGDILSQTQYGALVNPTNSHFKPGSHSLDRYVFEKGGPLLLAECQKLGAFPVGHAVVTGAYDLPFAFVIHVAGMKWSSSENAGDVLAQCYQSAMEKALEFHIRSLVFPSIGTGSNGFPTAKAAGIAINTVSAFLEAHPQDFDLVDWVLKNENTHLIYASILHS